jgi:DUF1680 family protein
LLAALVTQWENTVARRTYLTGGWGSRHTGEAFGADYELPPDRAYCETCAGISAIMFSWRLYLATGELRYTDLIERILFNIVATSPSADGTSFFYANPLHQREPGVVNPPDQVSPRADSSQRSSWFAVSCCPTNLSRTFASLGAYVAAWRDATLDVLQYAGGTMKTTGPGGHYVELAVTTRYPYQGSVAIDVVAADAGASLRLRVPAWSAATTATLDGTPLDIGPDAVIVTELHAGSRIVLDLDVAPRWTFPDHHIDAVRGCVAVEAGPLVLVLESVSLPAGLDLHDVAVLADAPPAGTGEQAQVRLRRPGAGGAAWPYAGDHGGDDGFGPGVGPEVELIAPLRPYHQWGEAGPTQMRVWLPLVADH